MRRLLSLMGSITLAVAGVTVSAPLAAADKFDGSVPLLCAAIDVMECGPGGDCQRRSAEAVNLPALIRINVGDKAIKAAHGGERSTPILRVERANGRLILQGGQEGRGWSMVINEETGKLAASVVDEQVSFAVFGACTTP